MISHPPLNLPRHRRNKIPCFGPEIPNVFSTLDEARNNLDWHHNMGENFTYEVQKQGYIEWIRSLKGPSDTWPVESQCFAATLEQWYAAFKTFLLRAGESLDNRQLQAARILEINYIFLKLFVCCEAENVMQFRRRPNDGIDFWNSQMTLDLFHPLFERVVALASLVVDSTPASQVSVPQFCLDTNVVAPLYAVAHRCRDPYIRRKAVSLLRKAPRREGIWDSVLTTKAAEIVIAAEEEGLGEITSSADVPGWARISDVQVKFDMEGRLGTLVFSRPRNATEKVSPTVVETFRW